MGRVYKYVNINLKKKIQVNLSGHFNMVLRSTLDQANCSIELDLVSHSIIATKNMKYNFVSPDIGSFFFAGGHLSNLKIVITF
jgi:hypothetical protein